MIRRLTQNKPISHSVKLIIWPLLLCAVFGIFFTHPVAAEEVKTKATGAKYYVNNGKGSTDWHSQGATMTKEYYIWTDWKKSSGPTTIVMCKRSNPTNCWRSSQKSYGHASTLWHNWGSDYFLIKEKSTVHACWSISKKQEVDKKYCNSSAIKGAGSMNTHSVPQGYTRYGDYFLRSFGNTPGANYITLYDKNFKKIKDVKLPNWVNEVEDVMVDGATGSVYFSTLQYVNGKKQIQFHKISDSVFGSWIKPGASSSSSGNSPSSGDPSSGGSNSGSSNTGSSSGGSSDSGSTDSSSSGSSYTYTPAESTYDGKIDTIFFGTIKDDGSGCGVYSILGLVFQILTIGVGILAVLGITIFGINYLTAAGDVAKATKAKHRIFEIILGLAIYAVLYSALNFLIPEFNPEIKTCNSSSTTTSSKK